MSTASNIDSPPGPHPASTNKEISTEYRCDVCDAPFPSESTLQRHSQDAHSEVGPNNPTTGKKQS